MKKLWVMIMLILLIVGGGLGATWWKLSEQKRVAEYFEVLGATVDVVPMFPGWFEDDFFEITQLHFVDTQVKDLSPLASLTSLDYLDLLGTQVADITPLSTLTSLTGLRLSKSKVKDIVPLSSLTSLVYLGLDRTQVTDITPLSTLTSLTELNLTKTKVTKQDIAKLQKALPRCKIVAP